MVRFKNAIAGYFVGPVAGPADKELAGFISTVTPNNDENVESVAFYSGDGTPQSDVVSVAKGYTFEGFYDDSNDAMKFIGGLEFLLGDARKVLFRQVRTNGDVYEGVATVTEIDTTGGDASAWEVFNCTITWDQVPDLIPPTP